MIDWEKKIEERKKNERNCSCGLLGFQQKIDIIMLAINEYNNIDLNSCEADSKGHKYKQWRMNLIIDNVLNMEDNIIRRYGG